MNDTYNQELAKCNYNLHKVNSSFIFLGIVFIFTLPLAMFALYKITKQAVFQAIRLSNTPTNASSRIRDVLTPTYFMPVSLHFQQNHPLELLPRYEDGIVNSQDQANTLLEENISLTSEHNNSRENA